MPFVQISSVNELLRGMGHLAGFWTLPVLESHGVGSGVDDLVLDVGDVGDKADPVPPP